MWSNLFLFNFQMNYLAHLYLSGDSEEIKLGNFIGDYVKGNKYLQYPEQVAFGIKLHRRIDFFTDQHADVKECMKLLRPGYGRYSGVVSDFWLLPVRVKQFLPFLIQHRRLESYANRNNLLQVLDIMSNRTSLPANSQWAIDVLYQEYDQFEALFRSFFAELIGYVELDFAIKITKPVQAQ